MPTYQRLLDGLPLVWAQFLGQVAPGEAGAGPGDGAQETPGLLERIFGGAGGFPIMLLLMFAVIYFLMIRPESKRQKARDAMLKSLKKGDNVVTTSGILGKIHRVDEKEVILHVDKDSTVKIRCLKSAVGEVLRESEGSNGGKS